MMRVAAIFILALAAGCGSGQSSQSGSARQSADTDSPAPADAPVVNASAFWSEFGENEIKADQKYKGKFVQAVGNVSAVSSAGSTYFVGFGVISFPGMTKAKIAALSPQERKWFDEGFPPNVICNLAPSAKAKAADLKPGDRAAIVGKVVGRQKDGNVYQGYVVVLDDCRIVPLPAEKNDE